MVANLGVGDEGTEDGQDKDEIHLGIVGGFGRIVYLEDVECVVGGVIHSAAIEGDYTQRENSVHIHCVVGEQVLGEDGPAYTDLVCEMSSCGRAPERIAESATSWFASVLGAEFRQRFLNTRCLVETMELARRD